MSRVITKRRIGLSGALVWSLFALFAAVAYATCEGGGEEGAAKVSVSPTSLTFGENQEKNYTVTNSGSVSWSLSEIWVLPEVIYEWGKKPENACVLGKSYSPGQSCKLSIFHGGGVGFSGESGVKTSKGPTATVKLK